MTNIDNSVTKKERQLTRSYDVFISYKRTPADIALRDRFFHAIEQLRLIPFADEVCLPAGVPWESAIESVLKPPSNAVLMVLGTESVLRDPEWVKREVDVAKKNGVDILLVQYAEGVDEKLGLTQTQYRKARTGDRDVPFEDLVDGLRRDLHDKLRWRFIAPREAVEEWVAQVLDSLKPDFWGGEWPQYFKSDSSVALLADGGSGKTVCLAHFLGKILAEDRASKCHAMMIDGPLLRSGADCVPQLIGARPGKSVEHAARLKEDWDEWFLFVVDGLDRVGFEDDEGLKRIKATLQSLSECGRVVVTCRRQVWENDYQDLSFKERFLVRLSIGVIDKCLPNTELTPSRQKILEVPLFLDYAIRVVKQGRSLPDTTTNFLQDIYDEPEMLMHAGAVPQEEKGEHIALFMRVLARRQLEKMTFEVPAEEVSAGTNLSPDDVDAVVMVLRNTGILHESRGFIRLRHDLIDGAGMVRLLVAQGTGKDLRESLWAKLNGDCGWSVASSLLLAACERDWHDIITETFDQFTYILDHKRFHHDRFGGAYMARSWAITYALRERIREVWPTIIEYLNGDLAASPNPKDPAELHRKISCPGLVTQETASTFASSFLALTPEDKIESPDVVRVLKKWLERPGYKYKFRFVQALAKLHSLEAREALLAFARQELAEPEDTGILEILAMALGELHDRSAIPVLSDIHDSTSVSPRARRLALKSLNDVDPLGRWPQPEITEEEMVEGLSIGDKSRGYSDWQRVSEYAAAARKILREAGSLSERVVDALINAMEHEQTFVKKPVAECLGLLDGARARDTLLSALLKQTLTMEVRTACITSLRAQFLRQPDKQSRLLFRLALLLGADAAKRTQVAMVERDLLALATNGKLFHPDDWLVTPLAVQALPPLGGQSGWEIRAQFVQPEEYLPCISADEFLTPEERARIGSPWETKYRPVGIVVEEPGKIIVRLAPADWVSSRAFHMLVSRNLEPVIRALHHWPEPIPIGTDLVPGILAIHCVVATSDNRLLLVRRSYESSYYPAHWSLSFEEQVCEKDFQQEKDFITAATRRGFGEEFGDGLKIRRLIVLSGLIEVEILNFGLVVLLEMNETADSIITRWRAEPRPTHHHEAIEMHSEPFSRFAEGNKPLSNLVTHPTSELRAALWRRWYNKNNVM